MLPELERNKINAELIKILSGRDLEASWKLLFPKVSVVLSAPGYSKDIVLTAGTIFPDSSSSSLRRNFDLPPEGTGMVENEVTLKIAYESVVPRALPLLNVRFPWLTQGCLHEIIVNGETEYFVSGSYIVGEPKTNMKSEKQGKRYKLRFESNDLILPTSRYEIRWQLKDQPIVSTEGPSR